MIEILKQEIAAREESLAIYRLNILKFERMIARIDEHADQDLQMFARDLHDRLASERAQCAREQLTRDVTAELLAEMEANP